MNSRAIVGLLFVIVGALMWLATPHQVTWGNHHYFKHMVAFGFIGLGTLFLLVGSRR
jgi:hypothetical protein